MVGCGQVPYKLSLSLLMIPMLLLLSSSQSAAREFHVGGKDGWLVKPSEDYNHWAQRNRFQVNDTLNFKYKKGSDSALVVKREDYDSCNTNNPIKKMDDGNSTFQLTNSGPFFFVSGNVNNCKNGQKLIVLVMAIRHPLPHVSPPSPSPASGWLPPETHSSNLTSPVPSQSHVSSSASSVGGVFGVGVLVIMIFTSFARLV